jgi:hypothetical protein
VRRFVAAGTTAPPATTGASSVFASGRAAGTAAKRGTSRLPSLDIDALTVKKGVPLPLPLSARGTTKYDDLFAKLTADGDCIAGIPRRYKAALCKAAQVYLARRPELAKSTFVVRGLPDTADEIGIWRLPKPSKADKAGQA